MEELPFACDLQTVGKLHEVPFPIQQRRLQKASARHFSEKASDTLCNPMSKPRVEIYNIHVSTRIPHARIKKVKKI
jgi:hypothetical protein